MANKKNRKAKTKATKVKLKRTPRRIRNSIKKAQLIGGRRRYLQGFQFGAIKKLAVYDKGQLGSFGKVIVFRVNSKKILTFKNLKRSQSGRWATHQIIRKAPKSEFLGPDLMEASMEVTLSAEHGVKPLAALKKIEKAVRNGTVEYLVIGGKIFGPNKHKWYIESVSETWDEVWNLGELIKAKVTINFREYV